MKDKSTFIAASLAFIVYGTWGLFANLDDGIRSAIFAALIQGGATFIVTFISVKVIENLFPRFTGVSRFILPVVIAFTLISGSIFVAHYIFATPNIIMTMAPSSLISIVFYLVWVVRLESARSKL